MWNISRAEPREAAQGEAEAAVPDGVQELRPRRRRRHPVQRIISPKIINLHLFTIIIISLVIISITIIIIIIIKLTYYCC